MIFAIEPYLVTPYRPLSGALTKNDAVLAACVAHPERFLVSPISGDPRVLVTRALTSPDNAAWEVWQNGGFVGILLLDRITSRIDARLQFVFFDAELASKAPLLNEFMRRCFTEFGLNRLTFEAPENMAVLIGFARRKLGFEYEGAQLGPIGAPRYGSRRERAYFDGERWHDIVTLRRFAESA